MTVETNQLTYLQGSIFDKKKMTTLSLKQTAYEFVEGMTGDYHYLKELDASDSNLRYLKDYSFPSLQELNLSNLSYLKRLVSDGDQLSGLEKLTVDGSNIELIDIKGDVLASISCSNTKELKAIKGEMPAINYIDADNSNLESISLLPYDDEKFQFKRMFFLRLVNCPNLISFQRGQYPKLRTVDLSNSTIQVLHSSLIKHLGALYLGHATIKEFIIVDGDDEDQLTLRQLRTLDLSNSNIPANMTDFFLRHIFRKKSNPWDKEWSSLIWRSVDTEEEVKKVQSFVEKIPQLKKLDISNSSKANLLLSNLVSDVPDFWNNLQDLDVFNSNIGSFSFSKSISLIHVGCSDPNSTVLKVEDMPALKALDVLGPTNIEAVKLSNCIKLEKVDFTGCYSLKHFESDSLSLLQLKFSNNSLETWSLNDTPIKSITLENNTGFKKLEGNFPNLETLDISNSPVEIINVQDGSKLKKLSILKTRSVKEVQIGNLSALQELRYDTKDEQNTNAIKEFANKILSKREPSFTVKVLQRVRFEHRGLFTGGFRFFDRKTEELVCCFRDINISDNEINEKCGICQKNYEEGQQCQILYCKHAFHTDCVEQMLQLGNDRCKHCNDEIDIASVGLSIDPLPFRWL
ncbi:BA75_00396T0 [Komagataella pastoris]|uniref:BA75_00396T0 n=1 Tax=Komagataella pastoris TaxID=4922 RepID=A0A1B2J6P5_PICPA|nr:BA75_00396T0 [Komagataella pastoris]